MQDYNVLNGKEGTGVPEVDAIATPKASKHDKRPMTAQELIQEQTKDSDCRQASYTIGLPGSTLNLHRNKILFRNEPFHRAVKEVLPKFLQLRILYHSHYPLFAGKSGKRCLYDSMGLEHYWTHIAIEAYRSVGDYFESSRNKHAGKRQNPLKLLRANGPLVFITMDIWGALPKGLSGNHSVLVITDRCRKVMRAIPMFMTAASHIASLFHDNWVAP